MDNSFCATFKKNHSIIPIRNFEHFFVLHLWLFLWFRHDDAVSFFYNYFFIIIIYFFCKYLFLVIWMSSIENLSFFGRFGRFKNILPPLHTRTLTYHLVLKQLFLKLFITVAYSKFSKPEISYVALTFFFFFINFSFIF